MKDKKLMKYYLRKSACGLASVSAAFIIGGVSVAADESNATQITSRNQTQTVSAEDEKSEIMSKADVSTNEKKSKDVTMVVSKNTNKDTENTAHIFGSRELKQKQWVDKINASKGKLTDEDVTKLKSEIEKAKTDENFSNIEKDFQEALKKFEELNKGNQQGFNLPESLHDVVPLPSAFDAKEGELIGLPKIDRKIKTLAGEWVFKGWTRVTDDENLDLNEIGDEFPVPGDGEAINLVGNWEFVPYAEAGKASEEETDSATEVDPENSASQEQDAELEPDQANEEVDDKAKELEDAQKEAEEALKNYGASSFYLKRIKKAKTAEGVKELMRQLLPSLKENVKKEATKDLAKYLESEKTVDEILAMMPKAKAEDESKAEEAGKVNEDAKDVKTPELPEQKEANHKALPETKAKEDHKGQGQGLGAKGAQSMPSAQSPKAVKGHILPSTGEKDMHNLLLASAASIVAASTMLTYGSIKKKKEN